MNNAHPLTPERVRELTKAMRPASSHLPRSQLAQAVKALLQDPQATIALSHRQALEAALPRNF